MFDRASRVERRFQKIARNIRPFELQLLEEELSLSDQDLFDPEHRGESTRFLGFYSHHGVMHAFEAYGILELLRERGYPDIHLTLDLHDPTHHRLRVYADRHHRPDSVLIDFAAHLGGGSDLGIGPPGGVNLLVIDWLMLQNPRAAFKPNEALPGQNFPGLGIGIEIGAMIGNIARRLKLDGCLAVPAWYHNAVIYSQRYTFVEPVAEGRFQALQRDTAGLSATEVSWAFEEGCVREVIDAASPKQRRLDRPLRWQGRCQIWPMSQPLVDWFHAPAWQGIRDAIRDGCRFEVDTERLRKRRGAG